MSALRANLNLGDIGIAAFGSLVPVDRESHSARGYEFKTLAPTGQQRFDPVGSPLNYGRGTVLDAPQNEHVHLPVIVEIGYRRVRDIVDKR